MTNLELDCIVERNDYPECLNGYSQEVLVQLVKRLKDRLEEFEDNFKNEKIPV